MRIPDHDLRKRVKKFVAVVALLEGDEQLYRWGLCYLLNTKGADYAYDIMAALFPDLDAYPDGLERGLWTSHRITLLAFLKALSVEDILEIMK